MLEWLGIDWDEGPVRQTERLHVYAEIAGRLVSEGSAYRCYCTPEELDAERKQRQAARLPLIYSGRCRNLADEQRAAFEAEGRTPAVRMRFDAAGETVIEEAKVKGIPAADHAVHLVVHGMLHLLGFDHERDADAERMEALETEVLAGLSIADPYAGDAPQVTAEVMP